LTCMATRESKERDQLGEAQGQAAARWIGSPRLASLVDQGIASALNFAHVFVVARVTSGTVLGEYVLLFGVGFLAVRIHAALVAMPLATAAGSDATWEATNSHFLALHRWTLTFLVVLMVPVCYVVGSAVSGAGFGGREALIVAAALAVVVNQELVRRMLLNSGLVLHNIVASVAFAALLVTGVALTADPSRGSAVIFVGYAPAGVLSAAMLTWLGRRFGRGRLSFSDWMRNAKEQHPLLLNNLSQWGSGQGIYYVAGWLLGVNAVGILAVLRNVFAPLHVALLSLEGHLPRTLREAAGQGELGARVRSELRVLWMGVPLGVLIVAFGDSVIEWAYGGSYHEGVTRAMLLGFLLVYVLAYASRVLLSALRAGGRIQTAGVASVVGMAVVLTMGIALAPVLDTAGIVWAMAMSELTIAGLFLREYSRMAGAG